MKQGLKEIKTTAESTLSQAKGFLLGFQSPYEDLMQQATPEALHLLSPHAPS